LRAYVVVRVGESCAEDMCEFLDELSACPELNALDDEQALAVRETRAVRQARAAKHRDHTSALRALHRRSWTSMSWSRQPARRTVCADDCLRARSRALPAGHLDDAVEELEDILAAPIGTIAFGTN